MKTRLFIALALTLRLFCALAQTDAHEVLYFYANYCEQCDPEGEFAERFELLTGWPMEECAFSAYNTVRASGKEALAAAKERFSLEDVTIPTVIVDGVAYQGAAQMNSELATEALSWRETSDSVILYAYIPACESCDRVQDTLSRLPESVLVKRGSIEFSSAVRVESLDASRSPGTLDMLFEKYGVPDDERVTPVVFFADRYLSGEAAINDRLMKMVDLGWAVGGVNADMADGKHTAAVTTVSAVLSGLAAGVNTCALSMLLLFLAIIMETGKSAGRLAACFLAAKTACYLLIGFVLMGVMQRFNPVWLKPAARWTLTAIGSALAATNIWDAVQAGRREYGKIKNQLPAGLRGGLRRVIQKALSSKMIYPAAAALGVIVAAGEFMCAGQLYLMQLLEQAHAGRADQAINLVVYCAAFVMPSSILSAVVIAGRRVTGASVFLAEHMNAFKAVTALAMLGMIALAWVV